MTDDQITYDLKLSLGSRQFQAQGSIPLNGCSVVWGASGAGKSTFLNILAGYLQPHAGVLKIRGTTLFNKSLKISIPAHKRYIGYLQQGNSLFPHLNIQNNLLLAKYLGKKPRQHQLQIPAREWDQVIDHCGVRELLSRRPAHLSGGENRRVALARTLLANPSLLLLDEPFSALDQEKKQPLLQLIKDLSQSIPIIYVTHNTDEVRVVGDRILKVEQLKIKQPVSIFAPI